MPDKVESIQVRPSTTIFGLIITWGPPSGSNYPTPVTYQLRYRERPSSGSPGGWSSTVQMTATQTQYTTPVLKPGTRYEVEVWSFVSSRAGTVNTMFGTTGESRSCECNVWRHKWVWCIDLLASSSITTLSIFILNFSIWICASSQCEVK